MYVDRLFYDHRLSFDHKKSKKKIQLIDYTFVSLSAFVTITNKISQWFE